MTERDKALFKSKALDGEDEWRHAIDDSAL